LTGLLHDLLHRGLVLVECLLEQVLVYEWELAVEVLPARSVRLLRVHHWLWLWLRLWLWLWLWGWVLKPVHSVGRERAVVVIVTEWLRCPAVLHDTRLDQRGCRGTPRSTIVTPSVSSVVRFP